MNDQDYIRAAVELADGFRYEKKYSPFASVIWGPSHVQGPVTTQPILDALAAQLVRQVVLMEGFEVVVCNGESAVMDPLCTCVGSAQGDDRTMNTIRAIVDSKVLE